MGEFFIEDSELQRVSFPDGNWVDVKKELTQDDRDYILTCMARASRGANEQLPDIELHLGSMPLLERAIVAWSFVGAEGKAIPVTPKNISRLRTKYRNPVLAEVNRLDAAAQAFLKN